MKTLSENDFQISLAPYTSDMGAGVEKLIFTSVGREDYAFIRPTTAKTWVVFFHSYGGDASEIFTSPLIHPLWLDAVTAQGYGLVSFNTYGVSWMPPWVAKSAHDALAAIRRHYGVDRFLFIGGSMGASSVLTYSIAYPQDVFAALAMCPVTDIGAHWSDSLAHPDPEYFMKRWAVDDFYSSSEEEREQAFRASSVVDHANKLMMPVVISHCADDSWIPVYHSDRLAARLHGKVDFRYFRYERGGHFEPSLRGFRDAWPWLIRHISSTPESMEPLFS